MFRSAGALVVIGATLAGCGQEEDTRPKEFAFIVESVFKPNCGAAECHSKFTQAGDDTPIVLDNVESARLSFELDDKLFDHWGENADEQTPTLIVNLTTEKADEPRMPLDGPMPEKDVQLVFDWIRASGPGLCNASTIILGKAKYCCAPDGSILSPSVRPPACK